jgi:glutamine synthetase
MRNEGGYGVMKKAIEKLGLRHKERMAAHGAGDEQRLTGRLETADINTFKWVKGKRKQFPLKHVDNTEYFFILMSCLFAEKYFFLESEFRESIFRCLVV